MFLPRNRTSNLAIEFSVLRDQWPALASNRRAPRQPVAVFNLVEWSRALKSTLTKADSPRCRKECPFAQRHVTSRRGATYANRDPVALVRENMGYTENMLPAALG